MLLLGNPLLVCILQGGSLRVRQTWLRMCYIGALSIPVLLGLITISGVLGETMITDLVLRAAFMFNGRAFISIPECFCVYYWILRGDIFTNIDLEDQ